MTRYPRTSLLLLLLLLGACTQPVVDELVSGTVSAGPTCPVVTDPPDPACANRPVGAAVLVVLDANGRELARTVSAADGRFSLRLPLGEYRLVPQPVEGLLGTAPPLDVRVAAGEPPDGLAVVYDTGIR